MTASLGEIVAAARRGDTSLAGESVGYIVLGVADLSVHGARRIAFDAVGIDDSGRCLAAGEAAGRPSDVEADLRKLLQCLLGEARTSSPNLARVAAREKPAGLEHLVVELEAALVPVNRKAARRSLARLVRETDRARSREPLEPVTLRPASPSPTGEVERSMALPTSTAPSSPAAPRVAAIPATSPEHEVHSPSGAADEAGGAGAPEAPPREMCSEVSILSAAWEPSITAADLSSATSEWTFGPVGEPDTAPRYEAIESVAAHGEPESVLRDAAVEPVAAYEEPETLLRDAAVESVAAYEEPETPLRDAAVEPVAVYEEPETVLRSSAVEPAPGEFFQASETLLGGVTVEVVPEGDSEPTAAADATPTRVWAPVEPVERLRPRLAPVNLFAATPLPPNFTLRSEPEHDSAGDARALAWKPATPAPALVEVDESSDEIFEADDEPVHTPSDVSELLARMAPLTDGPSSLLDGLKNLAGVDSPAPPSVEERAEDEPSEPAATSPLVALG